MQVTSEQVSQDVVRFHVIVDADETQGALNAAMANFAQYIEPKEGFTFEDAIKESVGGEEAYQAFCNKIVMTSAGPHIVTGVDIDIILSPEYTAKTNVVAGEPFEFDMDVYPRPKMTLRSYDPVMVTVFDDVPDQYLEQAAADECAKAIADRIVERIPIPLLEATKKSLYEEFDMFLNQRCGGISRDDYFQQMGMSAKDFDKQMSQEARANLRQDLALDAVFDHIGQELTDDDINYVLKQMGPGHEQEILESFRDAGQLYTVLESARRG